MIKRFVVCFFVFSMVALLPVSAWCEPVSGWEDVTRLTTAFSGQNSAGLMERTLGVVVKQQHRRYKRDVKVENPLDFRVLDAEHASVAVSAQVKKAGSARAKGTPAIFVLLFRKEEGGGLDHEGEHLIVFVGSKEVAGYKSVSDAGLVSLFKKSGATFSMVAAKSVKAKPSKPKKAAAPAPPKKMVLNASDIGKGVVAEKYIDASITRDGELKRALSGYVKKGELPKMAPVKANAGSPELQMKVAALEARIKELEALLSNVTRKGGNLYFNGVNVYVTNGTGNTSKLNGKGNIIVGYGSVGKGSHNLVVGSKNRYEGFAGVVSGRENVLTGDCGVVLGGEKNEVSGDFSVITGGQNNRAPGVFAAIFGGEKNTAKGEFASINGLKGRTKGGTNPHFTGKKTNE